MCVTIDPHEGSVSRPCDKSACPELCFAAARYAGADPLRRGVPRPRGEGYYPQLHPETCDGSAAQTWTISAEGVVRNAAERAWRCLGYPAAAASASMAAIAPAPASQAWVAKPLDQEIYDQVRGRLRWRGDASLCLAWIEQGSFVGLAPCNGMTRSIRCSRSIDMIRANSVRAPAASFPAGAPGSRGLRAAI